MRAEVVEMSNIVQDDAGTYRWAYEFNLLTNPVILFTVLKIFIGILAGLCIFMLILMIPDLANGYSDLSDVLGTLQFVGMMTLLFGVMGLVGYVFYALMMGGKYCVVFEMDEAGIEHRQLPKQYEKAQVIGALNVLAGLATGNPSQTGMGILAASRNSSTSNFALVTSIKGSRRLQTIKVNEPLMKNQVYVEPEDYDFVFNHIVSHCPNATKVAG